MYISSLRNCTLDKSGSTGISTRFPDAPGLWAVLDGDKVCCEADGFIGEQHSLAVAHYRVVLARWEGDVDVAAHFEFAGFAVDGGFIGVQDEAGNLGLRARPGFRRISVRRDWGLAEGRNEKY